MLAKQRIMAAALLMAAIAPAAAWAQTNTEAEKNQQKAKSVLNAMVQALGGEKWLTMTNSVLEGRLSGFSHGKPTGGIMDYKEIFQFPNLTRIEFGKKGKWLQIFDSGHGWEITYRGKQALPAKQVASFIRRRNHSAQAAVRIWMKDPKTILIYDGQNIAGRHLADEVTLINTNDQSVAIQTSAQTHLPLRISWQWRDPVYHDKDSESVEYADYHPEDGIATPFNVTIYRNGELVGQQFLDRAAYDVSLPPGTFNPDKAAAKLKK